MLSYRHTLILKAIAILGVLSIHLLSTLPIDKADPTIWGIASVVIDQLARFSVPLFIALSGYGLALKYAPKNPQPVSFIKTRLLKLLPLYLFWSILLFFLLRSFTFLGSDQRQYSFIEALIFGKADYQLYFIPMILQLYLLFPILSLILKKFGPLKLLVFGFLIQSTAFILYPHLLVTDQWQYTFFFPWIGYFTLGMAMTRFPWQKLQLANYRPIVISSLILSAIVLVAQSLTFISNGQDPLIATRFTRFPVMLYASLALISLFLMTPQTDRYLRPLSLPLLWIGKYSYLIFLSHTLILRLILLGSTSPAPTPELVVITGLSLVALITSPKIAAVTA